MSNRFETTRKCSGVFALALALAPAITLLLLLAMGPAAHAQVTGGESTGGSNIRIGFNRNLVSGVKYTLQNTAGTESDTNSDSMTGNDLTAEFILFNRFGIELNVGLLPMEREYKLVQSDGTLIANVDEAARLVSLSANLYFQDLSTTGFKFFFGLGAGTVRVSHRFSDGTLGTQSSDVSVTVSLLKFGMDWLTDQAGFRAQIVTMEGETQDGQEIAGYEQFINYTATVATIGVFTFF